MTVLGEPAGSAPLRRTVGYLTQAPSVYADLTVRENARYFASLYGLTAPPRPTGRSRDVGLADAAGQLVGTSPAASAAGRRWPARWSASPRLLVLDEPTVGQDPVLRDELWATVPRAGRRRAPRCWSPAT